PVQGGLGGLELGQLDLQGRRDHRELGAVLERIAADPGAGRPIVLDVGHVDDRLDADREQGRQYLAGGRVELQRAERLARGRSSRSSGTSTIPTPPEPRPPVRALKSVVLPDPAGPTIATETGMPKPGLARTRSAAPERPLRPWSARPGR